MISLPKRQIIEKIIHLQGLTCANCAAVIEDKVNNLVEVEGANINLINQTMTLKVEEKNFHIILDKVTKIVTGLEPHVKVYEENENISENNSNDLHKLFKEYFLTGMGFILFTLTFFNLSFSFKIALFLISYILIGGNVLLKAGRNIISGHIFDENFLMAIATLGAFAIKEFPEAVSVMLFYRVGEMLQEVALNRSRQSIKALLDIRPEYANLEQNGKLIKVKPEKVLVNDLIVVKPGERIPLDGVIVEGRSSVDTSALTGESVPETVEINEEVLAGFINLTGMLRVKVLKTFNESKVAKVLDLVQNAASRKAKTENFITRFARIYTPVVVATSLLIAIIPPFFIPGVEFRQWLYRSLIFLVVSCPCALVISIPLGFFGGIGCASRHGILVKGGNYLEALNRIKTMVFDKTGTITRGTFEVGSIVPVKGVFKNELLKTAAIAEAHSNHPIALSILKAYNEPIYLDKNAIYEEIPGHGVKVKIKDQIYLAGNDKLMKSHGINCPFLLTEETTVHVACNDKYMGYILISDKIKDGIRETIKDLQEMGIDNIVMLTGDKKEIARKVANEAGIDTVCAELLPDEKVDKLEEMLKEKEGNVAFIGDGINDAPVIARADVGIAMGGLGSDAAIEAADIVLMTDELHKVVDAINIAKKTKKIVWQNIIFALLVKGLVLISGAMGYASMWEAVFADVGVALLLVFNSMRVLNYKRKFSLSPLKGGSFNG